MSTLQAPFDESGRLDLNVVRSGNYNITEDDRVRAALIEEAEAAHADRELMRAVLEAIDLPSPATYGNEDSYRKLLEQRALNASTALRIALDGPHHLRDMIKFLRVQIESTPVKYQTTGGAR